MVRRAGRRVRTAAATCGLVAALGLVGCGEAPTPPNAIVQNYLNALGGGYLQTACGMLDASAREATLRSKGGRVSCPGLFRHCLPDRVLNLKHDQTQLLYASIDVSVGNSGSVASADTSGTPVASELKHVTLKHERGVWKLTSFGEAIQRCRISAHRSRRKRRASAA